MANKGVQEFKEFKEFEEFEELQEFKERRARNGGMVREKCLAFLARFRP
jgi:hypothetical protein